MYLSHLYRIDNFQDHFLFGVKESHQIGKILKEVLDKSPVQNTSVGSTTTGNRYTSGENIQLETCTIYVKENSKQNWPCSQSLTTFNSIEEILRSWIFGEQSRHWNSMRQPMGYSHILYIPFMLVWIPIIRCIGCFSLGPAPRDTCLVSFLGRNCTG